MSKVQKWIITTFFLLFGLLCLAVGAYFGSFWGAGLTEETILTAQYPLEQKAYECGVSGKVECFKAVYKDIAVFNATWAETILSLDGPDLNSEKVAEIKKWNLDVYAQLSKTNQ